MSFPAVLNNQRVIAVPVTPQQCVLDRLTVVGVVGYTPLILGGPSVAGSAVRVYIYYFSLSSDTTAAASSVTASLQWQFQNAAHVPIGVATGAAVWGNAGSGAGVPAGGPFLWFPSWPAMTNLAVPGGATEIVAQVNTIAIVGAPSVRMTFGVGIDITNLGPPGAIGGAGMQAQTTSNLNSF